MRYFILIFGLLVGFPLAGNAEKSNSGSSENYSKDLNQIDLKHEFGISGDFDVFLSIMADIWYAYQISDKFKIGLLARYHTFEDDLERFKAFAGRGYKVFLTGQYLSKLTDKTAFQSNFGIGYGLTYINQQKWEWYNDINNPDEGGYYFDPVYLQTLPMVFSFQFDHILRPKIIFHWGSESRVDVYIPEGYIKGGYQSNHYYYSFDFSFEARYGYTFKINNKINYQIDLLAGYNTYDNLGYSTFGGISLRIRNSFTFRF